MTLEWNRRGGLLLSVGSSPKMDYLAGHSTNKKDAELIGSEMPGQRLFSRWYLLICPLFSHQQPATATVTHLLDVPSNL